MKKLPAILSLYDVTTEMVKPWAAAGCLCYCVDLQHPTGETRDGNIVRVGADVMTYMPPCITYGMIFSFTPCTDMAASGARWFAEKGLTRASKALGLAGRIIEIVQWLERSGQYPAWMMENPVSTLATYYRKADHTFDPCDYAGYLAPGPTMDAEAFNKKTCLWVGNGFVMPEKKGIPPVLGSKMHTMPETADRANKRSATPKGFARAVFQANRKIL